MPILGPLFGLKRRIRSFFSFFKQCPLIYWLFLFPENTLFADGAGIVEQLADWLKTQHKGLRTYKTFQQKVMELGAKTGRDFALYSLLAALVGRFIDAYEESPLTLDVTDEAHKRLTTLSEKAVRYESLSAENRLSLLDDIAKSELG
jgi:hypothetical protein